MAVFDLSKAGLTGTQYNPNLQYSMNKAFWLKIKTDKDISVNRLYLSAQHIYSYDNVFDSAAFIATSNRKIVAAKQGLRRTVPGGASPTFGDAFDKPYILKKDTEYYLGVLASATDSGRANAASRGYAQNSNITPYTIERNGVSIEVLGCYGATIQATSTTAYIVPSFTDVTPYIALNMNYDLANSNPELILNTTDNRTLYENDIFNIDGTVSETDVGDTVTVRYQIGAGAVRAIKAYLSTGALESFGKQLTFKGGNLYDGNTLIASNLADGVAHTLKVYTTDDKGGTSAIIERTFYVVPNRVPLLTVNTPIIEGNINADLININGTFSDPDANNAVVNYRVNGGNSVQIAEGTSGVFNFAVSFVQLKVGENIITIEVIDRYGAKTAKTIKLNKKAIETPLLKSTQRYQLFPPSGTAVGVLFYIQRNAALDVNVAISMTQTAEAEQYILVEPVTTAPISQGSTIVEDEYYHAAAEPAEKILLQIDFTRTSITADEKIYVVMGAFE